MATEREKVAKGKAGEKAEKADKTGDKAAEKTDDKPGDGVPAESVATADTGRVKKDPE
jgi:hypothetical protein